MQKINKFAPVLIPTLNRFEHLKRCVESLSRCTYANKTDLYIALDYPLKENHWEGFNQIKIYIDNITGFNNVIIINREKNFGAVDNLSHAQKTIFEKYDRMILSEDDNEFSPNFLAYINWGLEKYKENEKIFAVCGYNYPIDMSGYDKDYYYANEYSAWGCGIWKDKWEFIQSNIFTNNYLQEIFNSFSKLIIIFFNRFRILSDLKKCKNDNIILGDVIITSYLHLYNKYSVFPRVSKVRNWGHDGSGINCRKVIGNDIFITQKIDENINFIDMENINISTNKYIHKRLKEYFSFPLKSKIKIIIKLIFNL